MYIVFLWIRFPPCIMHCCLFLLLLQPFPTQSILFEFLFACTSVNYCYYCCYAFLNAQIKQHFVKVFNFLAALTLPTKWSAANKQATHEHKHTHTKLLACTHTFINAWNTYVHLVSFTRTYVSTHTLT